MLDITLEEGFTVNAKTGKQLYSTACYNTCNIFYLVYAQLCEVVEKLQGLESSFRRVSLFSV